MKRKDIAYKNAREYIYSKDKALNNYIDSMLVKTNKMFHYENLPNSIPSQIMETMLQENGSIIFTKENGKFYIFYGCLGGELNEYYEYTKCIVANPYLKLNKEYTIGDDCILIKNDSKMLGLIPLLSKYGVLCNDCEISLNMLTNILRTQYFISASDSKTKENADLFIKKLIDGDFTTIGENQFLDGVKLHNLQGTNNYISQFMELNQYLKASAYNEIGLDANYNMKREHITINEVELNTSALIPLTDNMLECRKQAIKQINEKYGLNITVELSSVWKMQKESVDKATEYNETETEQETETETETKTETETEKPQEQAAEKPQEQKQETETEQKQETETENTGVENEKK